MKPHMTLRNNPYPPPLTVPRRRRWTALSVAPLVTAFMLARAEDAAMRWIARPRLRPLRIGLRAVHVGLGALKRVLRPKRAPARREHLPRERRLPIA